IERVGDNKPVPVDVRIISATNKNLPFLVGKGSFRKDFYFRINVIPIYLPPLRERTQDIPLLAASFFRKIRLKSGKSIEGISNSTMEVLIRYSWPGNVRELKSAFEYASVTCQDPLIEPHHLPPDILKEQRLAKEVKAVAPSRQEVRKQQLIDALARAKGNQSVAAEILGVSRVTVWNRMKRLGVKYTKQIG
ncbi:MAG: sigma 54-interacting transcriptional regulator, partial [Desulfobaccales bacterium]